jgi:predicted amidohydrolase YtcJ
MKRKLIASFVAVSAIALLKPAFAADTTHGTTAATHRYVVQRSFPKGALDGLDAAQKKKVNQTNARFGVTWVMSYATPDKTKTYCIYVAPNEIAIRSAARANHLPVDSITEVPVTLQSH